MGFDTETGEMLWSHEQTNTKPEERQPGIGDTHSNCVIYEDGNIYYANFFPIFRTATRFPVGSGTPGTPEPE